MDSKDKEVGVGTALLGCWYLEVPESLQIEAIRIEFWAGRSFGDLFYEYDRDNSRLNRDKMRPAEGNRPFNFALFSRFFGHQ